MMRVPVQIPLQIVLHQRTALVTVETVRAVLGVDSDTVSAWIDSGRLRWVWDIAAEPGRIRELRIWGRDLIAPCDDPLDLVIDAIIGTHRDRIRSVEVSTHMLLCSRVLAMQLVRNGHLAGPLIGHTQWITRESLVAFLRVRHIAPASVCVRT